jgi:Arm DNA-binding domain
MLTDIEIRKVKAPTDAASKKLTDSGGLYLEVTKTGSKLWRMAYRFNGKQKTLYIGGYPLISLTEAREKRDEAKRQLLSNIDPSSAKQAAKAASIEVAENSFQVIALEWHKTHMQGKSEAHAKKCMARLNNGNLY